MLGKIILIIVILLVGGWFALGYLGLRVAILRGHELNIKDRDSYKGTSWDKFYEPIMSGIAWIESHERERIEITSADGLRLVGRLTINPEAKGIALMFHGYRTHPEIDFSASTRIYYEAGYHTLHIDQRAAGESEGKYIGFGVLESRDCKKWVEYASERFGADFPIVIAGLSMGASTVLMAAGQNLPKNVVGIVADSAFSSPAEIIEKKIHQSYKIKGRMICISIGIWAQMMAKYSLVEESIPKIMETNTIPVLFAHGSGDSLVPLWMTQKAIDSCKAPKKVLISEGAEHGTGFIVDHERYVSMLQEFLGEVC